MNQIIISRSTDLTPVGAKVYPISISNHLVISNGEVKLRFVNPLDTLKRIWRFLFGIFLQYQKVGEVWVEKNIYYYEPDKNGNLKRVPKRKLAKNNISALGFSIAIPPKTRQCRGK